MKTSISSHPIKSVCILGSIYGRFTCVLYMAKCMEYYGISGVNFMEC